MMHRERVPCELCDKSTVYTATKRCPRCYELEHRIQRDPELARKVLAALEEDVRVAGPSLNMRSRMQDDADMQRDAQEPWAAE